VNDYDAFTDLELPFHEHESIGSVVCSCGAPSI